MTDDGGMTLTVWVDDWQVQCCGQSFGPGDRVSWSLLEVDAEDYTDILEPERAAEIDFREEHHGQEDGHPPAWLEVLGIVEVHCRYEVPSGSGSNVYCPVPGTTILAPTSAADGWPERRPDVRFAGYLVTAQRATDVPVERAPRGE